MYTRKREYMRDTSFPFALHFVAGFRKRGLLPKGSPLDTRPQLAIKLLSLSANYFQ